MDATFVINPGSASKKYALYIGEQAVLSVTYERVAKDYGKCVERDGERQRCESITGTNYDDALAEVIAEAVKEGLIPSHSAITRIGLRIVAPGTFFQAHRLLSDEAIEKLRTAATNAPLHLPHILNELELVKKALPDTPVYGISDSAFHATIPAYLRTYPIDQNEAVALDLYRFGYHGLSVASVANKVTVALGAMPEKMLICHVGSGVSITALKNCVSVDTSMGYAPGSGLMMGARAGDMDPGAIFALMAAKQWSVDQINAHLNGESGFKALLGSSDLRVVLERYAQHDEQAEQALAMYFARIHKQIGAFVATLGGLDTIALTATAAERNPTIRARILEALTPFGVVIDAERNELFRGGFGIISAENSPVTVCVVTTDEMREIARLTARL